MSKEGAFAGKGGEVMGEVVRAEPVGDPERWKIGLPERESWMDEMMARQVEDRASGSNVPFYRAWVWTWAHGHGDGCECGHGGTRIGADVWPPAKTRERCR